MLLAPAWPRAKPSQSASPSSFTSQREKDDESALVHSRARSHDLTLRWVRRAPQNSSRTGAPPLRIRIGRPLSFTVCFRTSIPRHW